MFITIIILYENITLGRRNNLRLKPKMVSLDPYQVIGKWPLQEMEKHTLLSKENDMYINISDHFSDLLNQLFHVAVHNFHGNITMK